VEIFAALGYMPTIIGMGERFGLDPDIILGWAAEKVYGILLVDFEKFEYQRRYQQLQKIFEKKT